MAFRNLHRKVYMGAKYLKAFAKADPDINKYVTFRTGFNAGYIDAIKWVLKGLGGINLKELKMVFHKMKITEKKDR